MEKFHRRVPISYQELGAHKVNRSKVFLKMCNEFKKLGVKIITGDTDNHLMLISSSSMHILILIL